ncbi:MAG: hypothetical protein AB1726_16100, partial [Planctomycetota bacterium]
KTPGLLELWRLVPGVGLGDPVRLMAVASLALGLAAGEALQAAPRASRAAALLVLLPLAGAALWPRGAAELAPAVAIAPEADELLAFTALPAARIDGVDSPFEGWLYPGLPVASARLAVEPIDSAGEPRAGETIRLPLDLHASPSAPEAARAAPAGAVWFRTPFLLTSRLAAGSWRLTLELLGPGEEEPFARRSAGAFTVAPAVRRHPATLLVLLATLLFLLFHPPGGRGPLGGTIVALALLQGLFFGRGANPTVPRAAVFPPTRTEAILAAGLGPHRFLADPGVLPADTGLVRGLSHLEGYDAMDVAAFNDYRVHVLPRGVNPLLAWSARGVDPTLPAFRLYGVGMFAMREPYEHPEWELVASPAGAGEARAETWIYRARDPWPRAFCVPRVVSVAELARLVEADPRGWDPRALAALDEGWRPAAPFATASVGEPVWTNSTVRVRAELDGDGLLVLTDQAFPGWRVFVDGVERELLTADLIFRAVALEAGAHEIEFRYDPLSIRLGAALSALAGLGILALAIAGMARRPRRPPAPTLPPRGGATTIAG